MIKKCIAVPFTVLIIGIFSVLNIKAYATDDSLAYTLNRLGILDNSCQEEISTEYIKSALTKISGRDIEVVSTDIRDIVKAIINAVDYEYLINDKEDLQEYIDLAESIGLLQDMDRLDGNISHDDLEQLLFNALTLNNVEREGYDKDASFVMDDNFSIISKRFNAVYDSGRVDGYYGDGAERIDPLGQYEYTINNEKYFYYGPQDITGRQISFYYIEENNTKEIVYIMRDHDIVIHERTGKDGKRFFRRGIPFSEGELKDISNLRLRRTDGFEPELQCETIEKYPDGSVKWASVAFTLDIKANERYYFDIITNEGRKTNSTALAKTTVDKTGMDNGIIKLSFNGHGISELIYNGKNILDTNGIRLAIENSEGVQYFTVTSSQIIAVGNVYSQIKLRGVFGNTSVGADWYIYLYAGDSRVYHEVTLNVKGYTNILSQYIEVNFREDPEQVEFEENVQMENDIYYSGYMRSCFADNSSVIMASQDVERFEKSVRPNGVCNGFVYGDSNRVLFAPIQYDALFEWPDGVSRTTHFNMLIGDANLTDSDLDREIEWCFTPPSLTISSNRFAEAGLIKDTAHSSVADRIEKMIEDMYGKLWKNFQAGRLPNRILFNYDDRTGAPENSDRSPGETEYNLWLAYMNCGNERLFDIICESAEQWSDVYIYRGEETLTYGCNRYFTGPYFGMRNSQFEMSQPFYGDLSGMYMTYLMTGDIRYRDTFKLSIDNILKGVNKNGVPSVSYWGSNRALVVNHDNDFHIRFMIQARGLAFAYNLFGDAKYLEAGKSIASFIGRLQTPEGYFYENYDLTTLQPVPGTQGIKLEPHVKLYLMLYGARGMMDFYKMTGYEPALETMKKLADFLLTEQEEDGWIWSPNSSNELWDYGDQRGCDGVTNSLITSFFSQVYSETGDVRYFDAALRAIRFYIAEWGCISDNNILGMNRTNFLGYYELMCSIIKNNKDLAIKLGYIDVVALMDDQTSENLQSYPDFDDLERRCVLNVFDSVYGRMAYIVTMATSLHSETYNDKFIDIDFKLQDEKRLWFGDKLKVDSDGVHLQREMTVVDIAHLIRTDIYLLGTDSEIEAEILEYSQDKIVFTLEGKDDVVISVADGFYKVAEGSLHTVTVDGVSSDACGINSTILTKIDLGGKKSTVEITRN